MRLVFIRQSKGKSAEVAAMVGEYADRIRPYASVELHEPRSRGASNKFEAPAIWTEPSTRRIVLDERGRQFSSTELSVKLRAFREDPGVRTLAFFVGAPYGIPAEILDSAHEKWSLSKGTLPSDLAWLVLVEQIYRGFSILAGSPYHHE